MVPIRRSSERLSAQAPKPLSAARSGRRPSRTRPPGFYRTAQAYAAAFSREVDHAPDYHDAEATAACLAFSYALQAAHSTDRDAVRDAFTRLDVVTFFGQIKFDERGVYMYKPMVVNQIQGANFVTIDPYRLAKARPVYPAPAWNHRETAARE